MLPKINFSKVKTISVEAESVVNVWYQSGYYRRFTDVDLDALKTAADKAGITIHGLTVKQIDTTPNALAEMLRLSPEQAERLQGADRLNFWRNGNLSVQVQHGSRSVKIACPKAIITDAQLVEHFTSWGWQQLSGKLYFRCTSSSLVQL